VAVHFVHPTSKRNITISLPLPLKEPIAMRSPNKKHESLLFSFDHILVSLCLKANVEMVPKIPNCHYMLLM